MNVIKALLGFFIKVIIGIFLFAIVWWLVTAFFPSLSIKKIFANKDGGWLPSPKNFSGILGEGKVPNENENIYEPNTPYNGFSNEHNKGSAKVNYVTYTTKGEEILNNKNENISSADNLILNPNYSYQDKVLYIRNLSIYEGGHIYTGLSFIGEAKNTMFKDGKFPILIYDNTGKIVSVTSAEATTIWSTPGWVRFQAKITGTVPNKVSCTMIFQSGDTQSAKVPIRVAIPIQCN